MSETLAAPIEFKLPLFVAKALHEMPRFLEAVQRRLLTVQYLKFSPDTRNMAHDPEKGEVEFTGYGNTSVTFYFKYRHGEGGTKGSLDRLDRIIYRSGENFFEFEYLEHYCGCQHCHGMKYPFRPATVARYSFESYSEEARLHVIREFIGGVH